MSLVMILRYKGEGDAARRFAEEMVSSGLVQRIRDEPGNESYEYFFPMEDQESVVLIDAWKDQSALDFHHASPMIGEIMDLRNKYGLKMSAQRLISDDRASERW